MCIYKLSINVFFNGRLTVEVKEGNENNLG